MSRNELPFDPTKPAVPYIRPDHGYTSLLSVEVALPPDLKQHIHIIAEELVTAIQRLSTISACHMLLYNICSDTWWQNVTFSRVYSIAVYEFHILRQGTDPARSRHLMREVFEQVVHLYAFDLLNKYPGLRNHLTPEQIKEYGPKATELLEVIQSVREYLSRESRKAEYHHLSRTNTYPPEGMYKPVRIPGDPPPVDRLEQQMSNIRRELMPTYTPPPAPSSQPYGSPQQAQYQGQPQQQYPQPPQAQSQQPYGPPPQLPWPPPQYQQPQFVHPQYQQALPPHSNYYYQPQFDPSRFNPNYPMPQQYPDPYYNQVQTTQFFSQQAPYPQPQPYPGVPYPGNQYPYPQQGYPYPPAVAQTQSGYFAQQNANLDSTQNYSLFAANPVQQGMPVNPSTLPLAARIDGVQSARIRAIIERQQRQIAFQLQGGIPPNVPVYELNKTVQYGTTVPVQQQQPAQQPAPQAQPAQPPENDNPYGWSTLTQAELDEVNKNSRYSYNAQPPVQSYPPQNIPVNQVQPPQQPSFRPSPEGSTQGQPAQHHPVRQVQPNLVPQPKKEVMPSQSVGGFYKPPRPRHLPDPEYYSDYDPERDPDEFGAEDEDDVTTHNALARNGPGSSDEDDNPIPGSRVFEGAHVRSFDGTGPDKTLKEEISRDRDGNIKRDEHGNLKGWNIDATGIAYDLPKGYTPIDQPVTEIPPDKNDLSTPASLPQFSDQDQREAAELMSGGLGIYKTLSQLAEEGMRRDQEWIVEQAKAVTLPKPPGTKKNPDLRSERRSNSVTPFMAAYNPTNHYPYWERDGEGNPTPRFARINIQQGMSVEYEKHIVGAVPLGHARGTTGNKGGLTLPNQPTLKDKIIADQLPLTDVAKIEVEFEEETRIVASVEWAEKEIGVEYVNTDRLTPTYEPKKTIKGFTQTLQVVTPLLYHNPVDETEYLKVDGTKAEWNNDDTPLEQLKQLLGEFSDVVNFKQAIQLMYKIQSIRLDYFGPINRINSILTEELNKVLRYQVGLENLWIDNFALDALGLDSHIRKYYDDVFADALKNNEGWIIRRMVQLSTDEIDEDFKTNLLINAENMAPEDEQKPIVTISQHVSTTFLNCYARELNLGMIDPTLAGALSDEHHGVLFRLGVDLFTHLGSAFRKYAHHYVYTLDGMKFELLRGYINGESILIRQVISHRSII